MPTVPSESTVNVNVNVNVVGEEGVDGVTSSRSVSLPDFSSYTTKANDEDSKRVKRLARNRASARLRRLRKKNLVESYEGEVGVLESSLAKLRAHRWGVGSDPEALLEALSMDRGQQTIDSDQRKELITSILTQQREQVRNVMDCQLENMVLGFVARHDAGGGGDAVKVEEGEGDGRCATTAVKDQKDNAPSYMDTGGDSTDSLATELDDLLQLTPEQKANLVKATEGIEEERRAVDIVDTSLTALLSNSWLMNEGAEECTKEFTSILNTSQMSKFMLWADHNSEAIDELDYVNAPLASLQPDQSPVFVFGMEEGLPADES